MLAHGGAEVREEGERLLHHLYADQLERRARAAIARLDGLPQSWRQFAEHRLKSGRVENPSARLDNRPIRL